VWGINEGNKKVDFVGTADDGVWSSKAMKDFGCTFHSVVSLTGVIMSFLITPASPYDNQPVVERLDSFSHHLKHLLGDGCTGYLAHPFKNTPLRENSPTPPCKQRRVGVQSDLVNSIPLARMTRFSW
jgi:hypothetical protein